LGAQDAKEVKSVILVRLEPQDFDVGALSLGQTPGTMEVKRLVNRHEPTR